MCFVLSEVWGLNLIAGLPNSKHSAVYIKTMLVVLQLDHHTNRSRSVRLKIDIFHLTNGYICYVYCIKDDRRNSGGTLRRKFNFIDI